jgi:hypothetical protein
MRADVGDGTLNCFRTHEKPRSRRLRARPRLSLISLSIAVARTSSYDAVAPSRLQDHPAREVLSLTRHLSVPRSTPGFPGRLPRWPTPVPFREPLRLSAQPGPGQRTSRSSRSADLVSRWLLRHGSTARAPCGLALAFTFRLGGSLHGSTARAPYGPCFPFVHSQSLPRCQVLEPRLRSHSRSLAISRHIRFGFHLPGFATHASLPHGSTARTACQPLFTFVNLPLTFR